VANILLIEDMKGVRDSLEMILSSAGHSVKIAKDGKEGLGMASAGGVDLIITDIIMPEMDGAELIFVLRDKGVTAPIMAISGGSMNIPADNALNLASSAADKILAKPFSRDELLAAVASLI
jgi:two-component system OmpR family response regulator